MKMLVNLKPQCESVRKEQIYISFLIIASTWTQQSRRKGSADAEDAKKGLEASSGRILSKQTHSVCS